MKIEINIVENYTKPEGPFKTNAEYMDFVVNSAGQSYKGQYGTGTVKDGITSAREAYNAALPPPPTVKDENETGTD